MWSYVVTVELDDTNGLKATHTYTKKADGQTVTADQAEFVNEYSVNPVDEHLKVTKEISGTPAAGLADAEFEFTLAAVNGAPLTKKTTGTDGTQTETATDPLVVTIKASEVAAGKVADFGDITFEEVGTYQYTITETDKSATYPWFTFDTTPVTATVEVIDDPDHPGQLKVVHPITYSSSKTVEQATDTTPEIAAALITNTYVPGEVNFEVGAKKIFQSYTDAAFDFSFELYQVDGTTETKLETVTIEGGKITAVDVDAPADVTGNAATGQTTTAVKPFRAVPLSGAGTYTFKVKEAATTGGVVCKTGEYTYVVTAAWNLTTGKLEITDIKKNGESITDTTAEFINEYDLSAAWTPEINKVLNGRKMTDKDVFTFTVKEGTTLVATGKANADGTVAITYVDAEGAGQSPCGKRILQY